MNSECVRLHDQLRARLGQSPLSPAFAVWYPDDIPGPQDYCGKFNRPFLVSCEMLAPVLDWWSGHVDVVVDVQADDEVVEKRFGGIIGKPVPAVQFKTIVSAWRKRYGSNLRQFRYVVSISSEEVSARRFGGLDDFLKEIMNVGIEV